MQGKELQVAKKRVGRYPKEFRRMAVERLKNLATDATRDGRIYCASAGKSYVVKAVPKFEVLATSDLGDGGDASPAVSDGRLFLKGKQYLWCVGKK